MKLPGAATLLLATTAVVVTPAQERARGETDAATVLEKFIVTESAQHHAGDVLPTSRPVNSVFGRDASVLDLPRAVTVLTPELMRRFDLQNLGDLGRLGAGTQPANYFGIAGTPYLRGVKATTFFNGIARAYQRNEMPVSFGSLEAIDLVKGPAPAHLGAYPEGGYANYLPKSPFFDRPRGRFSLTAGSHALFNAQLDYGAPLLLGKSPAAYRVSLTGQHADSAWDNVGNDYFSFYGALKIRPRAGLSVFSGAEYYRFHSNENPGWNRVTQDLIDHGNYIIGEPQDITSATWDGNADRSLIVFPGAFVGQPANFRALILPAATAEAAIAPGLLGLLEDRRATDGGYRYTQAYFDGGGRVLTAPIARSRVLSDPNDYADSRDFLWFMDVAFDHDPARTVTLKSFVEHLTTDKHSSYGYAIATEQLVFEERLLVELRGLPFADTALTWGASARSSYGWSVLDFAAEPFNRRDILRPDLSANTVVAAGNDRDPSGRNLWSTTLGGSTESDLLQGALFAHAHSQWSSQFSTQLSARFETLHFEADLPAQVDQATPAQRLAAEREGNLQHGTVSLSALWRPVDALRLYATYQQGTGLQPGPGGTVNSRSNFTSTWLKEIGAKAALLQDRLFASLAGYKWQSGIFNDRENRAERLRGQGAEVELTWVITPQLNLIASAGSQRVYRLDPLPFRTRYGTDERIALESGSLDAGVTPAPALNPQLIYPGTPETQAKADLAWQPTPAWGASIGVVWSHAFSHNFERTLVLPESTVWRAAVHWRRGPLAVRLSAENLFNARYFLGADPNFSHNDLVTPAAGTTGKLTVILNF
jgi:iron complex outermembrane receptor protein